MMQDPVLFADAQQAWRDLHLANHGQLDWLRYPDAPFAESRRDADSWRCTRATPPRRATPHHRARFTMKGKSAVMAVVLLLASSPVARANVSVSGSADATSSGPRCVAFPQPQCLPPAAGLGSGA